MGAIADNSYNMYGTGKNQIDFAKQLRLSGYVTPQDQLVGSIVEKLPSIFMSLGQRIADNYADRASVNNDGELSVKGEAIQEEINRLLTEAGYNSLQELYDDEKVTKSELASYQDKKDEYDEQTSIITAQGTIIEEQTPILNQKNEAIGLTNGAIESINEQIKDLDPLAENYLEEYTRLTSEGSKLQAKLVTLEKEKENAEKKINEAKEKQKEAQKKINDLKLSEAEAKVTELNTEIKTIDALLNKINPLLKNLKKADGQDGRDVISSMTNNETKDITKIIGKLNKARADGHTEKQTELTKQLKDAFDEYKKNHKEGDNKTIDNLMKQYGVTWAPAS